MNQHAHNTPSTLFPAVIAAAGERAGSISRLNA